MKVTINIDEKILNEFDEARGLIKRSTLLAQLMKVYCNDEEHIDKKLEPYPILCAMRNRFKADILKQTQERKS